MTALTPSAEPVYSNPAVSQGAVRVDSRKHRRNSAVRALFFRPINGGLCGESFGAAGPCARSVNPAQPATLCQVDSWRWRSLN